MHDVSKFLHFSEHTLQEVALGFMALVYIIRIIWFLRHKAGGERQPPTGLPGTTPTRGILYSWANVAMPWAMESTRRKSFMYVQFVIFHLGVTAAIALSFIIPYGPGLLEHAGFVLFLQTLMGAACAVGVMRMPSPPARTARDAPWDAWPLRARSRRRNATGRWRALSFPAGIR